MAEAVSLIESTIDYLAARFHLETHRVTRQTSRIAGGILGLLTAAAVAFLGIVFLSMAAASWLSESLESRVAGLAIVGGVHLIAGAVALAIASSRLRRH